MYLLALASQAAKKVKIESASDGEGIKMNQESEVIKENREIEPKYEFELRLLIKHPFITYPVIAEKLGLVPAYVWNVGSLRQTPSGVLLGGVQKEIYWNYRRKIRGLRSCLKEAMIFFGSLEYCHEFLGEITRTSGEVMLEVDFDGYINIGDVVPAAAFAKLATYGVSFGSEVFPSGFSEQ